MRIGLRSALATTVIAAAIVSSTAGTAMAAAPAPQGKAANVFAKDGEVAKFAATSTFKLNLPKGDHAVLTDHGVRFLKADGTLDGGMKRVDVKDKAGKIHKATWTLKGDQLTQKIADVKGSTIEGVVVPPTTQGKVTTRTKRSNSNCFWDGVATMGAGLGVIGSVVAAPVSGGTTLAATGALMGGAAAAAHGVQGCF
ncbi:hypothetical protein ACH4FX_40435 [Streptomyces sp. NPDC018019]|uniref:hypothetical protein n=1 Tax=Streptomyces sp. NPDC018019 TaxID=3365030 RepID=UPI0037ADD8B0